MLLLDKLRGVYSSQFRYLIYSNCSKIKGLQFANL